VIYIIEITYFHRKLSIVIIRIYMYVISYEHICIEKLVIHGAVPLAISFIYYLYENISIIYYN